MTARPSYDTGKSHASSYSYLKGDKAVDGSIRIVAEDAHLPVPHVEKRENGVWTATGFGARALHLLDDLLISAAGQYIQTSNPDGGQLALLPFIPFDPVTGTTIPVIPVLAALVTNIPAQPDFSAEFTGTVYEEVSITPNSGLVKTVHVKTGAVAATEPVTICYYRGTDATGDLFWTNTFPASHFPANSNVDIDLEGLIFSAQGENVFVQYMSDENFSLKTDSGGEAYALLDIYFTSEEDILTFGSGTDRILTANGDIVTANGEVVWITENA